MRVRRDVAVGTFVVLGLVLFILFTVTLRNWDFMSNRHTYYVLFEKVERLTVGAEVQAYGVPVGDVASIDYVDVDIEGSEYHVRVTMRIDRDVILYPNARIRVITAAVIGETIINIVEQGKEAQGVAALPPGSTLVGEPPMNLETVATDLSERVTEAIEELIPSLEAINTFLNNPQTRQNAERIMASLASATERLDRTMARLDGEFEPLITSLRQAGTDLSEFLVSSREISAKLEAQIDPFGLNSQRAFDAWTSTAQTLSREIRLNSDQLQQTLERMDSAVAQNQEPLREALTALSESSRNLDELLKMARRGEGTVGALMTDRRPFDKLNELISTLSRSITGRRESIFPVTNPPTAPEESEPSATPAPTPAPPARGTQRTRPSLMPQTR